MVKQRTFPKKGFKGGEAPGRISYTNSLSHPTPPPARYLPTCPLLAAAPTDWGGGLSTDLILSPT